MTFNKKNAAMLALAVLAVIVVEGTGLSGPPKEFVGMLTQKVKAFFQGIFSKS